ncbi:hypothetical protein [Pontibacter mangrovi]|uniref:Uncharacterized protein n=1 Tax=Pontibacter mangrovi TaxID=2589816 RepID=A0A501WDX1_9BACT|nr:hypothetical protein [Pontibacter mangrovi]TPE46274.1 hypothetical protein FJM65_02720 [Pontibacter mangrovi]
MKKLLFAFAITFGSLSMYSCGGNEGMTNGEADGTVIDTDTTVSELEVERTVQDIDTTVETETETIEPENNDQ